MPNSADDDVVSVLVEPLADHTGKEVADRLLTIGATKVQVLAPGFVSANVVRKRIRELEAIAHVGIKATSQPT